MSSSTTAAGSSMKKLPPPQAIKSACERLGYILSGRKYAVVGGAACQILGSSRLTADVDFVVLKGQTASTRKILAADKDQFNVEPRTCHTYFKSTPLVEVEILAPPSTFMESFVQETPTVAIPIGNHSVSILHPILILNAKCHSILRRATDEKKRSDAQDIKFLLEHLVNTKVYPNSQQLSRATKEFVEWFIANYGSADLWENAKYDLKTGRSLLD